MFCKLLEIYLSIRNKLVVTEAQEIITMANYEKQLPLTLCQDGYGVSYQEPE